MALVVHEPAIDQDVELKTVILKTWVFLSTLAVLLAVFPAGCGTAAARSLAGCAYFDHRGLRPCAALSGVLPPWHISSVRPFRDAAWRRLRPSCVCLCSDNCRQESCGQSSSDDAGVAHDVRYVLRGCKGAARQHCVQDVIFELMRLCNNDGFDVVA